MITIKQLDNGAISVRLTGPAMIRSMDHWLGRPDRVELHMSLEEAWALAQAILALVGPMRSPGGRRT